jgi:kinase-associated protein B
MRGFANDDESEDCDDVRDDKQCCRSVHKFSFVIEMESFISFPYSIVNWYNSHSKFIALFDVLRWEEEWIVSQLQSTWTIGDIVLAQYKTGHYIGKVFDQTSTRFVVQVLAVVRHPEQGDLHNPHQADVPFFHQRKALAHNERALVYEHQLRSWEGNIPTYEASLQLALQEEVERMKAMGNDPWALRGLQELYKLAEEYSH